MVAAHLPGATDPTLFQGYWNVAITSSVCCALTGEDLPALPTACGRTGARNSGPFTGREGKAWACYVSANLQ